MLAMALLRIPIIARFAEIGHPIASDDPPRTTPWYSNEAVIDQGLQPRPPLLRSHEMQCAATMDMGGIDLGYLKYL
jgi:hypothetical protein